MSANSMSFKNIFYLDRVDDAIKNQLLTIIKECDYITDIMNYNQYILDSSCVIVKSNDKVIGFLAYVVDTNFLYIKDILVSKEFKNCDIDKKLLNYIVEANRTIKISIYSTNYEQLQVLDEFGFKVIDTVKDNNGIDILYLIKE